MTRRIECRVRGRVQLVMFRDFTARNARALGLIGTVQNMDDGSVAVVAEGEENALTALIQKLKRGPILARVDDVDVVWKDARGELSDFRILYK